MVDYLRLPIEPFPERIDCREIESILSVGRTIDAEIAQWLASVGTDNSKLYVSFATADYEPGIRILIRSLRAVSDVPIVVLTLGSWTLEHEAGGVAAIRVPLVGKTGLKFPPGVQHFAHNFSKLWMFCITGVARIVYLDADCLVLNNIDQLFDGSDFAAVPDLFVESRQFNGGVFAFSPSPEFASKLFSLLRDAGPDIGSEQGLTNSFFRSWTRLPIGFNFLRVYGVGAEAVQDQRIRVVHYVGKKPWKFALETPVDMALGPFDELWMQHATDAEIRSLAQAWRRDFHDIERKLFGALYPEGGKFYSELPQVRAELRSLGARVHSDLQQIRGSVQRARIWMLACLAAMTAIILAQLAMLVRLTQ
jgi:hypothetical protein